MKKLISIILLIGCCFLSACVYEKSNSNGDLHLKKSFYKNLSEDECTFLENIILDNKEVQTDDKGVIIIDYDGDKFKAIASKCVDASNDDKGFFLKTVQINNGIAKFNYYNKPSDKDYSKKLSQFKKEYTRNINSIIDKYFK